MLLQLLASLLLGVIAYAVATLVVEDRVAAVIGLLVGVLVFISGVTL